MGKEELVDMLVVALWAGYELTSLVAVWAMFGPFAALAGVFLWLLLFNRADNYKKRNKDR